MSNAEWANLFGVQCTAKLERLKSLNLTLAYTLPTISWYFIHSIKSEKFRGGNVLSNVQTDSDSESKHHHIVCSLFSWCSGYHIRLTRGRSPVRSRAKTNWLFCFYCVFTYKEGVWCILGHKYPQSSVMFDATTRPSLFRMSECSSSFPIICTHFCTTKECMWHVIICLLDLILSKRCQKKIKLG